MYRLSKKASNSPKNPTTRHSLPHILYDCGPNGLAIQPTNDSSYRHFRELKPSILGASSFI